MRVICEVLLRKGRKRRGTKHLFTFHLRLLYFFPDIFHGQTFTLIPLTNRKHVTVEKAKFYKRLRFWFFFSGGFLGPVSAPLSKLDSAIFLIRVKAIFGVDGAGQGCKSLLGQEAPQSSADGALCHPTPLPGCTAQLRSLGWFWWQLHFI